MTSSIHTTLEADGLLLATIDMPGRSMNVFSVELMDALDALMDRVESDAAVRGVVLTSGKPSFLAGAELDMVRGYTVSARTLAHDALFELCGRLGRQFVRLEACAKPWVAAVNGIALGGGLELAMACRARLVTDDPRTLIGLPEVRWGLLPGAGGTQRLPRLAGFDAGLALLLTGRSMNPTEAVQLGVFAAAVPADRLLDDARALARSLQGQAPDAAAKFRHLDQADVPARTDETVRALARRHGVSDADFRDYPAHETIIDCVLLGARQPLAEATATEMRKFLRLMTDPVAGQMVRTLFLNRQRAEREQAAPAQLRVQGIAVGALSPPVALWKEALAKTRLPLVEDMSLPPDSMQLTDSLDGVHLVRLAAVTSGPFAGNGGAAQAVLTPAGAYGRVLEIVKASEAQGHALASLASRMGNTLPYRSGDGASVLQRLAAAGADGPEAQSLAAVRLLALGAAPQAETLDVVACVAGLAPAYTGGPLARFWTHRARLQDRLDDAARSAWPQLEPRLREACG
ncbi:MAG TPA: enoyl-CoA hydratase-related protein [Methylibium sp.]|nr:enoyl-CoA hydratase-related protein [Methylibium sp.]